MQSEHAWSLSTADGAAPPSVADARPRIRLCVNATIGKSTQILYAGRPEFIMAKGFDVTVVCASSEEYEAIRARAQGRPRGLFQDFRFAPIVEVLELNGCPRQ